MSKKITKATRPIGVKPVNMSYKEFYSLFNRLSYHQSQFANWKINNLYLKAKGEKGWEPEKTAYMETKEVLQNSYIRVMGTEQARRKWDKTTAKKVLRGDISLPTFKNKRLLLGNNGFKLIRENGNFYIDARLTDKYGDYTRLVLLGLNKMRIKGYGQFICLERIFSGEYKCKEVQLLKRLGENGKYKIFVRFPYTFFNNNEIKLVQDRIMGVDFGIKIPAVCAFNDSLKRVSFVSEGIRLLKVKRDIQARRTKIQKQITRRENRKGRGKKYKLAPLTKIENKWDNFRTTFNHRLSSKIVDFAVKNGASVIQLEDLVRINKKKRGFIFDNWPLGELFFFIKYKAEEKGLVVRILNPQYTSQRCSHCGYINEYFDFEYRKKNNFPDFICKACGVRLKDGYNAAKNISIPDIDKIIERQMIEQGIKKDKEEIEEILEVEENTIEVVHPLR